MKPLKFFIAFIIFLFPCLSSSQVEQPVKPPNIILFLVEEHLVGKILDSVKQAGEFHKPGTGIAFVVPVEHVVGLESQMDKFKEEVRDSYF